MVVGTLWQMVAAAPQKATVNSSANDSSMTSGDRFRTVMALAEQGELKPVIDSVLPFAQIVDAHRRVDRGHKVGSLVLTFGSS
jgi:NADPH:quinone reductase-like Zn-dependent oxidoreductase